jgi:hypothetical protein
MTPGTAVTRTTQTIVQRLVRWTASRNGRQLGFPPLAVARSTEDIGPRAGGNSVDAGTPPALSTPLENCLP